MRCSTAEEKAQSFTIQSLLSAQVRGVYCPWIAANADAPYRQYLYDKRGILSRQSWSNGATRKVASLSSRAHLLGHRHHSTQQYPASLAQDHWTTQWESLATGLIWRLTSTNILKCRSCQKHNGYPTHQVLLKTFHLQGPLKFRPLKTLGSLPNKKPGNKFVVVMTGCYL